MNVRIVTLSKLLPLILCSMIAPTLTSSAQTLDSAPLSPKVDTSRAYIAADSTFLVVHDDGSMTERIVRVIRVKAAEGGRSSGAKIDDDKRVDLKSVRAYQIDKNGVVVDTISGIDQMLRTCGFGAEFALFSDECSWIGSFDRIATPYTVIWDYSQRWASASYFFGVMAQDPLWTRSRFIEIKNSPIQTLRYSLRGGMPEPSVTTEDGRTVWRWTLADVETFDPEDHLPWAAGYVKAVLLAPQKFKFAGKNFDGSSWSALARDYYELIKDNFRTSGAQNKAIDVAFETDDLHPLFALHKMICDKMRYVAIYFGFGGWVPHRSDETFVVGYGDCKDLSTMYASMLLKANVPAHVAVISTRNSYPPQPDFPRLMGFNHMILYSLDDNDTTWIDATCPDCSLGDLPASVEDVYALAIDPVGGGLVRTPASLPDDNIVVRAVALTINDDLSASAVLQFDLRGNPAHGMYRALNATDPTRMADWIRQAMGITGNFQVQPPGVAVVARELSHLRLRVTAKVPRIGSAAGASEVIDLGFIQLFDEAEQHDLRGRALPLDVGSPETVTDSIVINLPSGRTVKTLPVELKLESAFGNLTSAISQTGNVITIERRRTRTRYEIAPDELPAFAAYRDEATQKARLTIALTRQ